MGEYIKKRKQAFKYAGEGIVTMFRHEAHAKIHLTIATLVIIGGFILSISATEWCLVAICIGGVFMAEAFNTAIEKLCDKVTPERDPLIKIAKDVSAGAVLLFVLGAIAVGLIIYIPAIIRFLS